MAYADFVTAMMALFIVLWLMSTSNNVKQAIGGYFRDPKGSSKTIGTDLVGTGQNFSLSKGDLKDIKATLQKAIQKMSEFEKLKNQIEFTITPEGLRIELLETKNGTFFDVGSAELNQSGKDLLIILAQQLGTFPNKISIEGHTDSKPYSGRSNYSNWELSADRANAARRLMQNRGLRPDQVTQVRGFADQRPRVPDHSEDPSNRRVSLIVNNFVKSGSVPGTEAGSPVVGGKAASVEAEQAVRNNLAMLFASRSCRFAWRQPPDELTSTSNLRIVFIQETSFWPAPKFELLRAGASSVLTFVGRIFGGARRIS